MKKLLTIITIFICVFITGCNSKEETGKIYLEDKYYGSSSYIEVTEEDIESNKENYILFTYNTFCSLNVPCEEIFQDFMSKYNIAILSIPFYEFKETYLHDTVKYGPSILVVKNKKVVAYLDANKDEDLDYYQDVDKFKEWIEQYVYLEKK